ncbi:MAG: rRNA maturation RNase YbeY [candidate division Zixibacteria bacterium]|nr:rRNA maturation RNase YbeY [candidate division Zixibacteria bacterium]
MDDSNLFSNQSGDLPNEDAVELADLILNGEHSKFPVNIIFSDDKELNKLNLKFRNKDQPTDVLSFPADPELEVLGDIYISVAAAIRQATDYNATVREEILRLVCHGTLHLCGYDHHNPEDERTMKELESRYLSRFFKLC